MEQGSTDDAAHGPDRTIKVGAAVIGGLALLVLLTQGVGQALGVLGLAALVVGGAAAVRGRSRRLGIGSRRVAGGVVAAGLAVMTVGSAMTPSVPTDTAAADAAQTSAARTTSAPTSRSTSAPAERPFVAAPTTTTAPSPVLPPAPVLAMTCPSGGTNASPVYGQQISATGPFSVTITYGDGDSYTDDDQSLAAIFSHTYASPGSYLVRAVLTDVAGQTAAAECTYAWTAPAPRPAPAPAPASAPAPAVGGGSSSGSSSVYYQNCDAVRAAGAAPIYAGDPGFQAKFDRDGDGVGCEN
ncbi:excalibur calcium-binding domain-containing protein [Klenkia taihuensis]|uniref:Excalibur calcium-binding domain-containing protein n=1 Tax=Klenkia taihuensis TaxID=1225127 RepID=A0A1I1PXT9_9ACTN|nr:excalibur calcium-binding domain-containing protein [Klenkia taihuensis]GHE08341.1 hypothetical protein GCM10011381_08740 [Klenkia taihuensis]SFD14731.1 Excalibur calcium-binding domain-containing protein [Klenkia taihuensis]